MMDKNEEDREDIERSEWGGLNSFLSGYGSCKGWKMRQSEDCTLKGGGLRVNVDPSSIL